MRPHTAVWRPRSRPHGARSWLRLRWRGGVGPRRVLLDRRRSLAASRTRGSGGAIVHSGEREARLYLVGVEPRLLLLELLHGDLREMGALALLGVSEACLERRDALSQRRGVGRVGESRQSRLHALDTLPLRSLALGPERRHIVARLDVAQLALE